MTKPQMQKMLPAGKRPTAEVHHFTLKPMDVMMDNLRYSRDGVGLSAAGVSWRRVRWRGGGSYD